MHSDMDKLQIGIVLCLLMGQSLQDDDFGPKTFRGDLKVINSSFPRTPRLDLKPEDPALAYTRGVLSTRVIPSAYGLAMALGIPSNSYILGFLRARAKAGSTSMTLLYVSLALSDLLLLLSLAPRLHYHLNGNHWVFGEAACRLVTACFYGNVYCSAHTIACVSLKRYLAVVRPFLYRRLSKRAWTLGACLTVWGVFGVAMVPELLVKQSYQLSQDGVTTCHDVLPLDEASHALLVPYRLALVCLGFLLPFLLCVFTHVALVRHLGRSGCNWKPFIRVCTLVLLIFLLCFAPSGVLHMAHYVRLYYSGEDGLYVYYSAAVCLCCFHSCLDPFLCVLMSRTPALGPSKLYLNSARRRPPALVLSSL